MIQIIDHPNFNVITLDYDYSLLKLDSNVEFNTHIRPVCLPASNTAYSPSALMTVTGLKLKCFHVFMNIFMLALPARICWESVFFVSICTRMGKFALVNNTSPSPGWGTTSVGGNTSPVLREASVNYITNTVCNNNYGGLITDSMLCAAGISTNTDACQVFQMHFFTNSHNFVIYRGTVVDPW